MPVRTARILLAATVGIVALSTVACTDVTPRPAPSSASAVVLQDPASASVSVADDPSPSARAVATSRALFRTSPGVIVIHDGDSASADRATTLSTRLHVPVLLADATASTPGASSSASANSSVSANPSASASPSPSATPSTSASPAASPTASVEQEVRRLGASWYISVGGARLRIDGIERLTADDAPTAPTVTRASRATIVVTIEAADDSAAVATAHAVGATVVAMPGSSVGRSAGETRGSPTAKTDIAGAPDVIDALHAASDDATLLLGAAFGSLGDPEWSVRAARTGWQLPEGGQRPFTDHRYVALYGAPGAPALGVLGEQDPTATLQRVEQLVAQYKPLSDEPVVPAVEIIATVAAGSPGADGDYSNELPVEQIQPYIDAARAVHASVIIDLQPGRTDFLTQAKHYESLLEQPDVGLALDPEWRLAPDQVPLRQIGSVGADEVNGVSTWLADLVKQHDLPPKMFVLHQFRLSMLQDRAAIDVSHPELDTLIHVDGQGSQPDKQATWNALHQAAPAGIAWGWKNFFDEDTPVLTPEQTMQQVVPTPDLVTYQ